MFDPFPPWPVQQDSCEASSTYLFINRVILNEVVQLGWHFRALERWAAAVQAAAAAGAAAGSPYAVAIATGISGTGCTTKLVQQK